MNAFYGSSGKFELSVVISWRDPDAQLVKVCDVGFWPPAAIRRAAT